MRYSWQKMYIEIAKVVAKRSEDPHTKVGAVLVKDGCIIGVGYNGVPRHCNYTFDWNTDEKYKYVIHAEMNAIISAARKDMLGATLYLAGWEDGKLLDRAEPCEICRKLIKNAGIINVINKEEWSWELRMVRS